MSNAQVRRKSPPPPAELPAPDGGSDALPASGRRLTRGCHIGAWVASVVIFCIMCSLSDKDVIWPNDHFSDMNVLMSGENFAKHGFAKLHFLPVHYVGDIGDHPQYYLHYPPLPNIINGLMQSAGIHSLSVMRCSMAFVFVAGLFCIYWALWPRVGPLTALCAMIFAGTCSYSMNHGLSLHTHAYDNLFLGLWLLVFFRAMAGDRPRLMWSACWAILFTQSLFTFEFIPYAQIFMWVYAIATRRLRTHWRMLLLLASAPVVGVGLHVLQNILAVGWQAVAQDSLGSGQYTEKSRWLLYLQLPADLADKTGFMYSFRWPVLLAMGLLWLGLSRLRSAWGLQLRPAAAIYVASLAAAMAWYLLLPGHTIAHTHTVNQLLLPASLAVGGCLALLVRWAAQPVVGKIAIRLAAASAILAIGLMQVAYFRENVKLFTLPHFIVLDALGRSADLAPDSVILCNTGAEAQARYFLRRPMWPFPSRELRFPDDLPLLPQHISSQFRKKYFLLMGPSDRSLLMYLATNCRGYATNVPTLENQHIFLILFEIDDLYLPPEKRRGLDPATREAQLSGMFAPWQIPNFEQEMRRACQRQSGKLPEEPSRSAAHAASPLKPG